MNAIPGNHPYCKPLTIKAVSVTEKVKFVYTTTKCGGDKEIARRKRQQEKLAKA